MTPEQEDAHWALQGKPLMRAWRERCRLVALADEAMANRQPNVAATNQLLARAVMREAVEAYYGKNNTIRYQVGATAVTGCIVNGVEYTMEDL